MLVSVVIFLGYIFFKYNYNFTTMKQKILLRRRVDKIKSKTKVGDAGKNGQVKTKENINEDSYEEKVESENERIY